MFLGLGLALGAGGRKTNPNTPVATIVPVASGTAVPGNVLSVTNGTWTNSPVSYAYQWLLNGSNIIGATSSTYTILVGDQGGTLSCRVSATNAGPLTGNSTSNGIAIPASSGITAPVLTRTSPAGASPLTWTTAIDGTVYAGYFWRLQLDQTSSAFGAITQNINQMITPSEIAAGDAAFPGFVQPGGLYFMRISVEREDGQVSLWSNVLTDTITAASTVWQNTTGTDKSQYLTVSGSPLLTGTGTNGVGAPCGVRATAAKTGKKQFEVTYTTKVQNLLVGVEDGTTALGPSLFTAPGIGNSAGIVARSSGDIYRGGAAVQTGLAVWAQGDVISLEFDTAGGAAQFYRNGTAYGTQLTGLSFSSWYAYAATYSNDVLTGNFGQNAFTHALSSGYSMYG